MIIQAALLLLTVLFSCILWDALNKNVGGQLEKNGLEQAVKIADIGTNYIVSGDLDALSLLVNEANKSNVETRYVFVTDQQGKVLSHTFKEGFPRKLDAVLEGGKNLPYSIIRLRTTEEIVRDIMVPMGNGTVGYVHVGMTEQFMQEQIFIYMRSVIIIALVICTTVAVLAARITNTITSPLNRLVEHTQELIRGKPKVDIEITSKDEVGQLETAFRDMASHLYGINEERDRLIQRLREKERLRITLLRKVLTAQEDERKRISRELHDETGQALTTLMVSMRILADRASDPGQKELLLGARDVAASTLKDIRDLAVDLRPPAMDDLGLIPTMSKYITDFSKKFGIAITYEVPVNERSIHSQIATTLYRIMQESLTNVVKHSNAKMVKITLEVHPKYIVLIILDDGNGFKATNLDQPKSEKRLGLYGMRERAQILGGSIEIKSEPDFGTQITVIVPNLDQEGEAIDGTNTSSASG